MSGISVKTFFWLVAAIVVVGIAVGGLVTRLFWPAERSIDHSEPISNPPHEFRILLPDQPPEPRKQLPDQPPEFRIQLPDQPGWSERPTAAEYGLTKRDALILSAKNRNLGKPMAEVEGQEIMPVAPFVLAALYVKEGNGYAKVPPEIPVIRKVVDILREAKVPAFGSPVALAFPLHPNRSVGTPVLPDTPAWGGDDEFLAGIPVLPGTQVPESLKSIEFNFDEVVASEPEPIFLSETGRGINFTGEKEKKVWKSLGDRAGKLQRQPAAVAMYRYTGWNADKKPDTEHAPYLQLILPLEPGGRTTGTDSGTLNHQPKTDAAKVSPRRP